MYTFFILLSDVQTAQEVKALRQKFARLKVRPSPSRFLFHEYPLYPLQISFIKKNIHLHYDSKIQLPNAKL